MFRAFVFAVLTLLLSRGLGDGSVQMDITATDSAQAELLADAIDLTMPATLTPRAEPDACVDEADSIAVDTADLQALAGPAGDSEPRVDFARWSTLPSPAYLNAHAHITSDTGAGDRWAMASYVSLARAMGFGAPARKSRSSAASDSDEQPSGEQHPGGEEMDTPPDDTAIDEELVDDEWPPLYPPHDDHGDIGEQPVTVPEPATAPLFALGLAAMMWTLRRKTASRRAAAEA